MTYLYKIATAAVFVLLWHAFHLSPETAQLKDLLALLHSDEVFGHGAMVLAGLLLLDDHIGYPMFMQSRVAR